MPNNTHKSAAVPFVNQKGERSMKRVKVERYVAGKRPAYAKDDEDDEYYTTDEEAEGDNDDDDDDTQDDGSDYERKSSRFIQRGDKKLSLPCDSDENEPDEGGETTQHRQKQVNSDDEDDDDDDDDDPRFRRFKQIEANKPNAEHLLSVQKSGHISQKYDNSSNKDIVIEDDDDEEEIRLRHALGRRQPIEEPLGPQAIFGDLGKGGAGQSDVKADFNDDEQGDDEDLLNEKSVQKTRLDTDDFLKDFKLTGLGSLMDEKGPIKSEEEREVEQKRLKEALELAKQEAKFNQQLEKKIEDDLRRELEREALAKGDIGAREMSSVNTDDEDDELAYEEWKLREIKRVLRDRSERMLEPRAAKVRW